jgi:hypothetical protein
VEPPRGRHDGFELAELALDEGPIADRPVARNDRPADEAEEAPHGRRPLDRVAVAEVRHRVVLEEIAGEEDVGIGENDDDVGIGVAAAQVREVYPATADVEGRRLDERPLGRVDDQGGDVVCEVGEGRQQGRALLLAVLDEARAAPLVPPDRGRPEVVVAEDVVGVPVGVDDQADRERRQACDVGNQLLGVAGRRARVDDEGLAVAEHHPDLLVVEAVATGEDPVAHLQPVLADGHATMVRGTEYARGDGLDHGQRDDARRRPASQPSLGRGGAPGGRPPRPRLR